MSSKLEVLTLDDVETCKAWLIRFEALCRSNYIEDKIGQNGTSPKTDKFLEKCGSKPLLKIISMLPGKDIEKLNYGTIRKAIDDYIQPRKRLVIADRTNFFQLHQNDGESEVDFLSRINEASIHCNWNDLKNKEPSEELIKLRFISGLKDEQLKLKILEKLQLKPDSNINEIIDFCQMANQLCDFVTGKDKPGSSTTNPESFYVSQSSTRKNNCNKCGKSHKFRECPAFGKTCHNCGKANHFAKFCKAKQYKNKKSQKTFTQRQAHNVDTFTILSGGSEGIMQTLNIMDVPLEFQLDTGATVSIMSECQWRKLGSPNLEQTCLTPTNYDGSIIKTIGELKTEAVHDDNKSTIKFIVVKSNKEYGLIGRDVIDSQRSNIQTFVIETEYLTTIKGFVASVTLVDENRPLKFCKARPVPVHIKGILDEELATLQKQGVITPVDHAKQASPVVWVKKPNGQYRLCVDFKATLNPNIQSDAYPMPTTEEVFAKIGDASVFAKIDLKSAYSQIALDDHARELSVINTHKGLYTVNRLQMGMKNASAIFQRCIEHVLKGITGIVVYQDDVMVCATSTSQLKRRLDQVKKRLRENCVTINYNKCIEQSDSLKFLGFVFSKDGIKPDSSLVTKIADAKEPTNAKELSSFLGLVNYYGRFIQNFAEMCVPLNDAKKNNSFVWNDECSKSFYLLKQKITSSPVLQPFSLSKTSVLTTDASNSSIGAVLSQDGHPVFFISRRLTRAESNYSNIEREALAVLWACKRLEQFLLGKKFIIETDHKPLIYIYNPNIATKSDVSPRLIRFSLKMMHFDYEIKHIAGESNVIADSLSRVYGDDNIKIPRVHFLKPCIDIDVLKLETSRDRFLKGLARRITSGKWSNVSKWEKPFKRFSWQMSIDENDIIRVGSKVVPPQSLYKQIFDVAHQSHNGIQSTLRLIQNEFFWPGMRLHIEEYVKSCQQCRGSRFRVNDTTHTWPKEDSPWSRIHIDWAYHRAAGNVLVIVDATSGWLEAAVCRDRHTGTVIEHLRAIFARFGVPNCVVSDNAPEFTSHNFSSWLTAIGCRLVHSPEYHPQANGSAERMVRVIKDGLKCFNPSKGSVTAFIHRLLFVHRNTAIREGKTPAEILLGHKVRCPIISHYHPMQQLIYRAHSCAKPSPVKYVMRQGSNTQLVTHADGRTVLAHDSQVVSAEQQSQDDKITECRVLPPRNRAPPSFYGAPYSH